MGHSHPRLEVLAGPVFLLLPEFHLSLWVPAQTETRAEIHLDLKAHFVFGLTDVFLCATFKKTEEALFSAIKLKYIKLLKGDVLEYARLSQEVQQVHLYPENHKHKHFTHSLKVHLVFHLKRCRLI